MQQQLADFVSININNVYFSFQIFITCEEIWFVPREKVMQRTQCICPVA